MLKVFSHLLQNAWETKYPEEFVEHINLAIPLRPGYYSYVGNPLEDASLLKRIGAKRCTGTGTTNTNACDEYELKNAVTGTRFTFEWSKGLVGGYSHWRLQRME